ncbi:glutathione S-transferase T3-like [Raphanus sativus]|nr:glutathione S-transferase T3-like [Raphanus sativus]
MDPNYHHAQSSSYVGLLNSQDGSAFNENFPYESFHSSVNFGDSEPIPAFSSQQTQDAPPETPVARSKRKNTETSTQSSTTEGFVEPESTPQGLVEPERRPEGIKAAKAKRNTLKGKFVAEYAAVWDMKKVDLEKKETLSKLGILDSLIALAKVQPLTEAEEAVKNKLLAQYF